MSGDVAMMAGQLKREQMPGTEKKKAQDRERMQRKRSAEREKIASLEADIVKLNRLATDRLYFMEAYENMLGENGLKVAQMWRGNRVTRVHFSWATSARSLTGEERAAHILEWEKAPKNIVTNIDSHLSNPPSSQPQKDIEDE